MAVSAVPLIIDALVTAAASAMPTAIVSDGTGVTDAVGNYLMVGVDDPDIEGASEGASAEQEWAATAGGGGWGSRSESGDITCAALSWTGVPDSEGQKIARDAAYATYEAVATLLRNNPSLGVSQVLWLSFGTRTRLTQAQSDTGASALLIFTVHFEARL